MWEKEENLENVKELVDKFKGRIKTEVRRQEEVEKKSSDKVGKQKLNSMQRSLEEVSYQKSTQ